MLDVYRHYSCIYLHVQLLCIYNNLYSIFEKIIRKVTRYFLLEQILYCIVFYECIPICRYIALSLFPAPFNSYGCKGDVHCFVCCLPYFEITLFFCCKYVVLFVNRCWAFLSIFSVFIFKTYKNELNCMSWYVTLYGRNKKSLYTDSPQGGYQNSIIPYCAQKCIQRILFQLYKSKHVQVLQSELRLSTRKWRICTRWQVT